jgi:hypothetical protein
LIRYDGLEKLHDLKPAYRFIFIGPEGTWGTLVRSMDATAGACRSSAAMPAACFPRSEVRRRASRAVGRAFDFEILSIMPWVRRQLVADSYARGRVFICGDACHVMSPTGGFGMNTGIQDAVDLAWKLEADRARMGWAAAPAIVRNRSAARWRSGTLPKRRGNLKRMLSPRDLVTPREIFEPVPTATRARVEVRKDLHEVMRREWHTNGIHLGYRYEGSPVIVPDGTPEPEDSSSDYVQTARPGHRAPHVVARRRAFHARLLRQGFVLMRFDERAATDRIERAAEARGVPLTVVDIASVRRASCISVVWFWCVRTATPRGVRTSSLETPQASSPGSAAGMT